MNWPCVLTQIINNTGIKNRFFLPESFSKNRNNNPKNKMLMSWPLKDRMWIGASKTAKNGKMTAFWNKLKSKALENAQKVSVIMTAPNIVKPKNPPDIKAA